MSWQWIVEEVQPFWIDGIKASDQKKTPERWRTEADNVQKSFPVDLRNLFNYGVKSIQWHRWNIHVAND